MAQPRIRQKAAVPKIKPIIKSSSAVNFTNSIETYADLDEVYEVKSDEGGNANERKIHWQVLLLSGKSVKICSGAILNKLFILTSASCLRHFASGDPGLKHARVLVNVGNRCKTGDKTVKKLKIRSYSNHPKFRRFENELADQNAGFLNDAALIRVESPGVRFEGRLNPVCLPERNKWKATYEGESARISGWGQTSKNDPGESSCGLKIGEVAVLPKNDAKCEKLLKSYAKSSRTFCAADSDISPCSVDLGGPLTLEVKGQSSLIGIISYGPKICHERDSGFIYTNVGKMAQWVIKHIQDGECR